MHETLFLCLAVSRRDGGNCIAGVELESGRWIRPISPTTRGAFSDSDLIVLENSSAKRRFMAPLDVIPLTLHQYAGTDSQPENWIVQPSSDDEPYRVLRRFESDRDLELLLSCEDKDKCLLDSCSDSVMTSALSGGKLGHSLSLITPTELGWKVTPHPARQGRFQVRADFRFGRVPYSLVVTDPIWEDKCRKLGPGTHEHNACMTEPWSHLFLTVSLAAVPWNGRHYKLVAGVINLPA